LLGRCLDTVDGSLAGWQRIGFGRFVLRVHGQLPIGTATIEATRPRTTTSATTIIAARAYRDPGIAVYR
jgi:hypothetical protein